MHVLSAVLEQVLGGLHGLHQSSVQVAAVFEAMCEGRLVFLHELCRCPWCDLPIQGVEHDAGHLVRKHSQCTVPNVVGVVVALIVTIVVFWCSHSGG